MDAAIQELDRIVSLASRTFPSIDWNPSSYSSHPATSTSSRNELEDHTPSAKRGRHADHASDTVVDYFRLDQLGVNESGDTALHRLVGLHACPDAVQLFLDKIKETNSVSLRVDQRNNAGATALHVAVYKNSWFAGEIIKILIDQIKNERSVKDSLASIPMKCGSYPLHILCGSNLTIEKRSLMTLLDAAPSIVMKEDVNGDNPLSLLWKNVMRFRWAASMHEGREDMIHIDEGLAWMTVITPGKYIEYSLLLVKAARKSVGLDTMDREVTLHEICAMHRCPPLLLRLALSESQFCKRITPIQGDVYTTDDDGMLPIHHAAMALAATTSFLPQYVEVNNALSVFELLLEAYPVSATMADNHGRLPLHYALESGYVQERALRSLLRANPDGLRVKDPFSGLYPFQLVAASATATYQPAPLLRFPTWTQNEATGFARRQNCKEGQNIDVNYVVLRLCPEAVHFDQRCSSITVLDGSNEQLHHY